jgi:hypothetical protein
MGDKEDLKCLSPWLGLMVIMVVCLIMTSAIFFQTRPERTENKPRQRHGLTGKGALKPVYGNSGVTQQRELPQELMDRIIF